MMGIASGKNSESCHFCTDKSCAAAVLGTGELDAMNLNRHESEIRKGEIILHQGSLTSHIIYLKTGLVKEFLKLPNDRETILQIVKKRSYLGLQSLFGDKINRYSYAALEDSVICHIDISVFNRILLQNGEFASQILASVCSDSLNNFHRYLSQSQKRIYGRVADAILYFATIIYESDDFDLPFSRQEVADLIGVTRESATRALQKFREENIISISGHHFTINNRPLLEQIGQKG
jgi:CRP-like cAMP-binding protein